MKKLLCSFMLICLLASPAFAVVGDHPNDQDSIIWFMAASGGTSILTNAMIIPQSLTGRILSPAKIDKDSFAHWLQVQTLLGNFLSGQYLSYPIKVYHGYLSHIEGYDYNRSRVKDLSSPPESAEVSGTTITCDNDTAGDNRTPYLYSWNSSYKTFTQIDNTPELSGSTWTFSAVPVGTYVIAYDLESLPTAFLTVSE